jgi:hypothetical protein
MVEIILAVVPIVLVAIVGFSLWRVSKLGIRASDRSHVSSTYFWAAVALLHAYRPAVADELVERHKRTLAEVEAGRYRMPKEPQQAIDEVSGIVTELAHWEHRN